MNKRNFLYKGSNNIGIRIFIFSFLSDLLIIISFNKSAYFQLNENCIVNILGRTSPVAPDGTWVIPNIPADQGILRARATCTENGQTISGISEFFEGDLDNRESGKKISKLPAPLYP